MAWYIWETCDKKTRLTLQNMPGLMKYGVLDESTEERKTARRVYEFNRYLKAYCKDGDAYYLDTPGIDFLTELGYENLIDATLHMDAKRWDTCYQTHMDVFRFWIQESKDRILQELNDKIFLEDWNKYARGSYAAWEMQAMSFYYHEHELAQVDTLKYGIVDFNRLPEEPKVERVFQKAGKTINIFELNRICGTCIAKNKAKGVVSLLTTSGVVNVKLRKEMFSLYDKQISVRNADGSKTIMERSWFNRGKMIMVTGIRSGDDFVAKKYASTIGHTLYQITEILPNGELILQEERYQGELEEDKDED